jgi:ankyrin repeat protein
MGTFYDELLKEVSGGCGPLYLRKMLKHPSMKAESNIDSILLAAFTVGRVAVIQVAMKDKRANPRFGGDCCFDALCDNNHFMVMGLLLNYIPDFDPSRDGNEALRKAVLAGFPFLVYELLKDRRVLKKSTQPAFDLCLDTGNVTILDFFLQIKIPGLIKNYGASLVRLVELGQSACVARMLPALDGEALNWNCGKAVRVASKNNKVDCLLLLLNNPGIDIEQITYPRLNNVINVESTQTVAMTAILIATNKGHYDPVQLLLERAILNDTTELQKAFFSAIRKGHLELVRLFLKYPQTTLREFNLPLPLENHALLLATKLRNCKMVVEILRDARMSLLGAVSVANGNIYTQAMKQSVNSGYLGLEVLKTLLAQHPTWFETKGMLMKECVRNDNMPALKMLLDHNPNAIKSLGYATVAVAVKLNKTQALELFFRSSGITRIIRYYQKRIVKLAIKEQKLSIVRMLLDDFRVHIGANELDLAVHYCEGVHGVVILEMLCEDERIRALSRKDVDPLPNRATMLSVVLKANLDALACLQRHFNLSDRGVLTSATRTGNVQMVQQLLQDNKFVAQKEQDSLVEACRVQSWYIAQTLVEDLLKHLDPAADDSACLVAACMRGERSEALVLVERLIEDKRANIVTQERPDNHPAMNVAINLGRLDIVRLLQNLGQVGSYEGYLLVAVAANQVYIVKKWLPLCSEAGLKQYDVRNALVTALKVAVDTGDTEMFDLLSKTGNFNLNNGEHPDALHVTWVAAIRLEVTNPKRAILVAFVKRISTRYLQMCLRAHYSQLDGYPGLTAKILAMKYGDMLKPAKKTSEERYSAAEAMLGSFFQAAEEKDQKQWAVRRRLG